MEYEIHPAAAVFPLMEGKAFEEFVRSIKEDGQRESIKRINNVIIDGRNRLRACEQLNVAPIFEEMDPKAIGDVVRYIIDLNIQRRHLTTDQRAAIAAELANMEHGTNQYGVKVDVPNGTSTSQPSMTLEQASDAMQVGRTTVARAKKRMKTDPQAHADAKAGKKPKKAPKEKLYGWMEAIVERVGPGVPYWTTGTLRNCKPEVEKMVGFTFGSRVTAEVGKKLADFAEANVLSRDPVALEKRSREIMKEAENLPDAQRKRFSNFLKEAKQVVRAEMIAIVDAQVVEEKARLDDQWNAYRTKEKEAAEVEQRYADLCMQATGVMTEEEFRFVRGVLHPDKHPGEEDRYQKAFDIFNRLLKGINWNDSKDALERRGWNKKSSMNPLH